MNKAYLLTGGNQGRRKSNLQKAARLIEMHCGAVIARSALYETAAWGKVDQPAFLNQALAIETKFSPPELLHQLLNIEKEMGRIRQEKYGPRVIDIDILLFGNKIIVEKELIIPHPALPQRRFALQPLMEIAPRLVHPVLKKTITTLFKECRDLLPVKKIGE